MDWEVINGITGIVGASCSVLGLGYFGAKSKAEVGTSDRIVTLAMFMSFLLISGGWALLCLCGLWIFEPFGAYVTSDDYLKFYAVILTLPSLMIFNFGLSTLKEQRT
ncbi:hypothetical protein L7E62_004750 [Vibrio parahaemolyticus]|uniref:hypothetical protein n=1 Tax=Vibrio parahaemolyticus TaxID=670 RepID=UPI000705B223|nr:hypothetical protein [Vibrio parahaemolyticus]ALG51998.1 hypothetical protein FORC6_1672 [Vibrio parahaemolyticus]EIV1738095.1 hypothetical protein [Vibrio parahaemolyticus]EIV8661066.1 hypothetical protein [Vibrio parahaemolyticus]MBE4030677.1 hypothetical protein [Vibrio parahaemolyticus]MBE4107595.1 hypothetical protein [Vibrio parahaemolyticus]